MPVPAHLPSQIAKELLPIEQSIEATRKYIVDREKTDPMCVRSRGARRHRQLTAHTAPPLSAHRLNWEANKMYEAPVKKGGGCLMM